MNSAIAMTALQRGGLLMSRDLESLGLVPSRIAELVRSGELVRLRRGAFVTSATWVTAPPAERHRLLVKATDASHPTDLLFSHQAAAALHGLPLIGPWPERVHVLDSQAQGGSSMPTLFIHRTTAERESVEIDGLRATSLRRTLVDIASTSTLLVAVAMIDQALSLTTTTREALLEELAYVRPGRGARRAAQAIYFSDGRCESVGESLSRVRMWQLGFAPPELQFEFRDGSGSRARVDFAWNGGRIVGEFDGLDKYRNPDYTRGRSASDLVIDEKVREDRIRPLVDRFVRWGWDTAFDARRFGAFLQAHGVPRRGAATFSTDGNLRKGGHR